MTKQAKPAAKAEETKQAKPAAKKAKADGVKFVYIGDKKEVSCFDTDFEKGKASLVKSELGIKKLSAHPHFEKK